jgi:imidazolonepropionase-like amidohydrolase
MRSIAKFTVACLSVAWFATPSVAEQITAVRADRIETISGDVIENGVIVVRDTKISQIGTDIEVPSTAQVIDVSDKTVFPGLVNPVSTIGLSGAGGGGGASGARYRVADGLYPYQHNYQRALQAGFTTLGLAPMGQGITGQGAIVRPVGQTREEMLVSESSFLWIGFRANDRTKKLIKGAFDSAKNKKDTDDPNTEPLVRALQGDIPTFVSCTRPADTVHLLELVKAYEKMKVVLVIGYENYHITDQLTKQKMPVIVPSAIDSERYTRNRINVPNILASAGVKIVCVPASNSIAALEDYRRAMAELVKCGLDRDIAKKAMTLRPAEALGIDYRLGSLEKGKDANLLILDGDVLDVKTTIHKIMVEGKIVYEDPWGQSQ